MSDLIDRQTAIDALERIWSAGKLAFDTIKAQPSAQPEITLESAIDYLHSIGWMQEHDRVLTESAQPEPIRPKARDVYYEETDHCEFKCSICGATIGVVEGGTLDGANFKYCPWCGAELDGEVRLWDD